MKNSMVVILALVLIGLTAEASQAKSSHVNGYFKKDGTYVAPHYRTAPDSNPYNNYSTPGNLNPNSGTITGGSLPNYVDNSHSSPNSGSAYGSGQLEWVNGYYKADGTWVPGYWRQK